MPTATGTATTTACCSFETNTQVVPNPPKDWADLLKPEYKGQVALPGDPNVANQAIQTILASDSPTAVRSTTHARGWRSGSRSWTPATSCRSSRPGRPSAQGETPITVRWNYNALANRDQAAADSGLVIDVAIPASGPYAGVYIQGISAYAPHPNAAKLWEEYLYSDEGQNAWLSGYCYPARFEAMKAAGTLNADSLAKLPDATGAVFPTLDQLTAAAALIADAAKGWNAVVGAPPVQASAAP